MIFRLLLIVGVFVSALAGTLAAETSHRDALPMLNEYFDLLSSENYDIASDMWSPEALERSSRFGINYSDIPMKVDCTSPVIRNHDAVMGDLVSPVRQFETLEEGVWYKIQFGTMVGNQMMEHYYHVQRRGDWFWFGYPQDFYAADWPIIESKYVRIHVHPEVEQYLNELGLAAIDEFIETTAKEIDLSRISLAEIAEKKIEYFYCDTDSTVFKITGHLTRGMLDLASNDLISAHFPHFHELSHLLVNIKLKEFPLYTLPFAREGLATVLGGRWGQHSPMLMDLAVALYREELIDFPPTLTLMGFDAEAGADIVYSIAGLFNEYLIDMIGYDEYFVLYRQCSGSFDQIHTLSLSEIKDILTNKTGHADFEALMADFEKYIDRHNEKQMVALPGVSGKGKTLIEYDGVTVKSHKDWLEFVFNVADQQDRFTLNFWFDKEAALEGQSSYLFETHLDTTEFLGYRYAVRFDANEAGLYDYVTNQMLAKYIFGITPSDEYYDRERGEIKIRFRKSLLGKNLPDKSDFFIFSQ